MITTGLSLADGKAYKKRKHKYVGAMEIHTKADLGGRHSLNESKTHQSSVFGPTFCLSKNQCMGTHDDPRESLISIMVGFPLFCIASVQYSSHVGIHTTPFEAHPLLTNGPAIRIASAFVPRRFDIPPAEARLFQVDAESQLLGHCHWQP